MRRVGIRLSSGSSPQKGKYMQKKITSQRDLEQFVRELFIKHEKKISCQLKTMPKRYIVKVDGCEVSYHHVEQYKAYNEALKATGIPGSFTYKYDTKKDTPVWVFKGE
jgi:hypothetical protein